LGFFWHDHTRIANRFEVCEDGCVIQSSGQIFNVISVGLIELGRVMKPKKILKCIDVGR